MENLAKEKLDRIIKNKSLDCLSEEEQAHLKSHISFQHGRTKFARDKEENLANYLFNLLKPNFYNYSKKMGKNLSMEEIGRLKIVLKSNHTLLISMLAGILLYDLKIVLLENKSKIDFIFSDNPVILFNSFFNKSYPFGTTGLSSTGLQIFYPINSKFMLFLFDSNFYEIYNLKTLKVNKNKDIQRLNGLQILNCNDNIYFENPNLKDKFIERYNQLKSLIPKEKNEYEIIGTRTEEDGKRSELLRTSSPKIYYNLKKLSFLKHKSIKIPFGIRDKKISDAYEKIVEGVYSGKIKSMDDLGNIIEENLK